MISSAVLQPDAHCDTGSMPPSQTCQLLEWPRLGSASAEPHLLQAQRHLSRRAGRSQRLLKVLPSQLPSGRRYAA